MALDRTTGSRTGRGPRKGGRPFGVQNPPQQTAAQQQAFFDSLEPWEKYQVMNPNPQRSGEFGPGTTTTKTLPYGPAQSSWAREQAAKRAAAAAGRAGGYRTDGAPASTFQLPPRKDFGFDWSMPGRPNYQQYLAGLEGSMIDPSRPNYSGYFQGLEKYIVDPKKWGATAAALQYNGYLEQLAREQGRTGRQGKQNEADIGNWYQQLLKVHGEGAKANVAAGQKAVADSGEAVTAVANILGGANPAAGVAAAYGQVGQDEIRQQDLSQQQFDNMLGGLHMGSRNQALTNERRHTANSLADLAFQIAQGRKEKGLAQTQAQMEAQGQAFSQRMGLGSARLGAQQASDDYFLRSSGMAFDQRMGLGQARIGADQAARDAQTQDLQNKGIQQDLYGGYQDDRIGQLQEQMLQQELAGTGSGAADPFEGDIGSRYQFATGVAQQVLEGGIRPGSGRWVKAINTHLQSARIDPNSAEGKKLRSVILQMTRQGFGGMQAEANAQAQLARG